MFTAVIETPDNTTYEQKFDDLDELKALLGPDYWIVQVYTND